MDQDRIAYIMYKQQEEHQQMLKNAATLNEIKKMHDAQGVSNLFHMEPKNANLDYQKWLLATGRNVQNTSINQIINNPKVINPNHYEVAAAMAHQNLPNFNTKSHHVEQSNAENTSKLTEVERIKKELLGYQREIELMQKQREYAKLMKQQKQQQQMDAEQRRAEGKENQCEMIFMPVLL